MEKTPIQEAISFLEAQINKNKDSNDYQAGQVMGYIKAKDILESLLEKEKEFAGKVWDAAVKWEVEDGWIQIEESAPPPDKQQFLNQLYPEK